MLQTPDAGRATVASSIEYIHPDEPNTMATTGAIAMKKAQCHEAGGIQFECGVSVVGRAEIMTGWRYSARRGVTQ